MQGKLAFLILTVLALNAISLAAREPVSWWKLDESSGETAADSTGNAHPGVCSGTSWAPKSGKIDGAAKFGGVYDYIQIHTTGMSPAAGTVAIWGRLDPNQSNSGPILHNSATTDSRFFFGHTTEVVFANRIQLYMDSNDTQLDLGLGDDHFLRTNIMTLKTERWYHIALTWDRGNYVVYVDAVEKAAGTYAGLNTILAIAHIGNDGTIFDEGFKGLLDDVRIYDSALTGKQIMEIYNSRLSNKASNTAVQKKKLCTGDGS